MKKVGLKENIKEYREKCGLSQSQLAKKIEVTSGLVGSYEIGLKVPSLAVIIRMADVFECSVDELLGRDSKKAG